MSSPMGVLTIIGSCRMSGSTSNLLTIKVVKNYVVDPSSNNAYTWKVKTCNVLMTTSADFSFSSLPYSEWNRFHLRCSTAALAFDQGWAYALSLSIVWGQSCTMYLVLPHLYQLLVPRMTHLLGYVHIYHKAWFFARHSDYCPFLG